MCILKINLPNLCPNMNHFDAMDFSECHSEEVISFFWCSVYKSLCSNNYSNVQQNGQLSDCFKTLVCIVHLCWTWVTGCKHFHEWVGPMVIVLVRHTLTHQFLSLTPIWNHYTCSMDHHTERNYNSVALTHGSSVLQKMADAFSPRSYRSNIGWLLQERFLHMSWSFDPWWYIQLKSE